jgi:hypothetical protein
MTSIIGWGFPPMVTVLSFSLFLYFIGKLKIMIEANNMENQSSPTLSRARGNIRHRDVHNLDR